MPREPRSPAATQPVDSGQVLRAGARRGAPFVLELVGSPGSGKSSVARALVEGTDPPFELASPRGRVGSARIVRNAVGLLPAFTAQLLRRPNRPWYRYMMAIQLRSYAEMLDSWSEPRRVAVLDQGPVYLLSILQRMLRGEPHDSPLFRRFWTATLAEWSRALDLVVVLDARTEVLLERIRRRGTPHPVLWMPPDAARRFVERRLASRGGILDALAAAGGSVRILRLESGSRSAASLADEVRGSVLARRSGE
jgi:hypothetical protein